MLTWAAMVLASMPMGSRAQAYHYDVNGDGEVNVTDVTEVVNHILYSSNNDRRLKIYVTEDPYTTEQGNPRNNIRRAPEITTSSLSQFYVNLMYDDEVDGKILTKDASLTYFTGNGYYKTAASWPTNAGLSNPVTVFGYYDKRSSCLLDEDKRPFLDVILEENSSEQYDVLVAKETKTYKESQGVVNLHFHHACAAVQFSIQKSAKMKEKGYQVEVSEVVLHNILKRGKYMLDKFEWSLPEASDNTVSYFTINAYQNGEQAGSVTLNDDEPVLLAKDENDFLFLLPTNITKAEGDFSQAGPGDSYLEIKCKIFDNENYKVGLANEFQSVFLPFGYDLSGYKGKIKSFLITLGTSIRDENGNPFNL